MKSSKGFTLVELMIVVAIVGILALIVSGGVGSLFVDNRGATEQRAYEGAKRFVEQNNIDVKRMSCAGDSDGDGYGTCTIVSKTDERIQLMCPTNYIDTQYMGAVSCKEAFQNVIINQQ